MTVTLIGNGHLVERNEGYDAQYMCIQYMYHYRKAIMVENYIHNDILSGLTGMTDQTELNM